MSRIGLSAFLAAALATGVALAQTAPPDPLQPGAAAVGEAQDAAAAPKPAFIKPAPKAAPRRAERRAEPGGLAVTINNRRYVGLVELDLGPAGGELKKVQGALAFGRKTVVHVPRVKDCLYDIKGHFADEADTEQTGLNLCKDKAINLTDE
jgi:hypothetical protein